MLNKHQIYGGPAKLDCYQAACHAKC